MENDCDRGVFYDVFPYLCLWMLHNNFQKKGGMDYNILIVGGFIMSILV